VKRKKTIKGKTIKGMNLPPLKGSKVAGKLDHKIGRDSQIRFDPKKTGKG